MVTDIVEHSILYFFYGMCGGIFVGAVSLALKSLVNIFKNFTK